MASKAATRRLQKEVKMMESESPELCYARPMENDQFTWYFILRGPPDTPYAGGEYMGSLSFPQTYPFAPPTIKMQTPSGRFKENEAICTSFSNFHPGSWNPAWSISNILVGMLSLMTSEEMTTGAVTATTETRKAYAARSHKWNLTNVQFKKVFSEYAVPGDKPKDLPNMGSGAGGASGSKQAAATNGKSLPSSTSAHTSASASSANSNTLPTGVNPDAHQAAAGAAAGVAAPPAAGAAGPPQPPPPLLSTRTKVGLLIGFLAWLFVARLISRA